LLQNLLSADTTVQPGSIGDLSESTLEEMVKSFNPADIVNPSIPSDTAEDGSAQADKTLEEKDTDDLLAETAIGNLTLLQGRV
jgi:hypothetical protein